MLESGATPLDGLLRLFGLKSVENTRHHRIVVHVVTAPLMSEAPEPVASYLNHERRGPDATTRREKSPYDPEL